MTHRVYLRWPPQRATDRTTTDDRKIAEDAFNALRNRQDLVGQRVWACWTEDGKGVAYHAFHPAEDVTAEPPKKR